MTLDVRAENVRAILPYPLAPILTVYTPGSAAYMKVTPSAEILEAIVRSRVTTESLVYAPLITHKIADSTTTISAADPDDLAKSKTAANEMIADCNTHKASLTYHVTAGAVIVPGHKAADTTNTNSQANMSSLATGYVLADEMDDDCNAHVVSTTYHLVAGSVVDYGGTPASEATLVAKVNLLRTGMLAHYGDTTLHSVADVENARLVTATTVATNEASAQTLINLLKTYWNSHCGVGAASAADLAAVIVDANALRAGLLAHFASTTVHGGVADATNTATLTAVAVASDQATANTLLTAEKATYNAHCAIVDGGAYATVAAGSALSWFCRSSFFAKTSAGGVFTVTEFKSA